MVLCHMAPVKHRFLRRPEYLKINLRIQVSFVSQICVPSQETGQVLSEIDVLLDMVEKAITVCRPTLIFTLLTMIRKEVRNSCTCKSPFHVQPRLRTPKELTKSKGQPFSRILRSHNQSRKSLSF